MVAGDYCGDLDGDGDYDETDRKNAGSKSVMNLYGGRIYGGKAQDGGNIMVLNASDLNMYGGTIENGTATTKSGGNILSHSTGNLNIYGGSVKNGTAATYGGNIVNNYGTLRIYDGQIVGGKAGTFGGSIHNGKNFYLYGGTISGGTSGNNAGGNIMIGSGSQLNMYGGTIKDGTAPASYGGNIQILGTAYLCGGTIQNGTAKYGGGNVSVYNKGYAKTLKATSTRENLLIVDGKAPLGSNIYVGYSGGTTPTLNLTWGSFLRGSIYAGATAKTTISGDVKVSRLELSSGRTVTFGTLTDGAEIFVSMADRTGSFGTGTEQTLAYLKADYAIRQENGNLSLVAPDALNLRYDDRKNLSDLIGVTATNVTITDQVVTSKRIGSTTPDAAVLTYDAATDTLYAVGTGTATVMAGGKAYPVTVEAAPISLLMITGHSIGEGYLANGDLSVVSEAGQVYGSFGRESLVSSVGGLGYGADSRVSTSLDVYTAGQGGSPSGASALGWRWNQQTGEKVWVLNAAVSGACINEWLPGAKNHSGRYTDYFNTAVTMFQNAQTVLKNEVEAGHYTLSHMAMFYFNGANFQWYEGWTNAKLEADYATFWNGMKEALTVEVQGKSRTVETLGLVPAWSPSLATYSYDKAASFYMAASDAYPDIYIALDYRNWVTELDAFPVVEYTTQSGEFWIPESILHTNKGGTSDHSVFCYNDYTHHSQIGYNAIGICIADSLRARLAGEAATGAVIQTLDTKDAPETMTVDLGETVDLAVLLTPVWGSNVKITVSGELSHSYPLSVTATGYAGGRVTVSLGDQVLDTLTIQVRAQHKHCQCGGSAVGVGDHTQCEDAVFTPISTALARVGLTVDTADFGQLPSGYYYLDTDVTVTATGTLGSRVGGTSTQSKTVKDVVLCLNGNNITTTTGRIFGYIYMDSSLSICDCSGAQDGQGNWSFDGTVYGGNTSYGQIIYTLAGSALHIYGGNFTSANTGVTGGLIGISCESCGDQNGDGAYNDKDYTSCTLPTVFNLYNGRLYDGKANVGGNLALFHTASANLYGGVISGGVSATYAGNVVTFSTGALHIAGTVIENGTAGSYGGNVVVTSGSGKLTMKGGAVKNGVAKGYCGNIYNAGTFYLYDGLIEGGTSARYSGSVQSAKTFYMYGGTIRGGNARESGGNLMVGTGSRFNIYGGTIENGIAGEGGGNVQILGTTYLCGGTVQGGQAKYGGNICVYNKGEMYALKSGNTKEALLVTGGTATNGQGDCIYAGYTGGTTPTLSLKFGSYEGCVYAGNTAKVVLGETQLERLYLTNGRTVTMAGNANVTETVVAGDAYLDLAGYGFTGNAIGEGTLYLMDSSSDGYTLPTGKLTGSVSCRMSGSFKTDAKRYLVLDAENGYTSHRFYLGITKLTLRPGETGFGYKARFCGDEAVKARLDSFGFHLNLDGNDKVVTRSLTGSDLNTQKEYALVLRNFDIAAFGETPVNAKVFMVFKDGTQIETDCVSYSMQTMLQKLCGMMDDLSEEKRLAVKTMCQPYADIMKNWNIDALIH